MTNGYQLCSSPGRTHGGGVGTHLRESLCCEGGLGLQERGEVLEGTQEATVPCCRFVGLREKRGGCCCAVSPAWCIYLQGGSRRGVGCDGASTGSVARSPRDAEAAVAGLIVIPWENCKMSPIVLANPTLLKVVSVFSSPLKTQSNKFSLGCYTHSIMQDFLCEPEWMLLSRVKLQ